MNLASNEEILSGIQAWVEIESQTADASGVNQMMDSVEGLFRNAGASVQRIPGRDGFADHVSVQSQWGGEEPGILVLSHLDTVHPRGTIEDNPFRVEGDRAYGPGIYDMKGGAYLGFAAYQSLVQDNQVPPLPIRFLFVSDEEVGSPTSRALIERAGDTAKFCLVTEPARYGGKCVTARNGVGRYQLSAHGRPAHSGSQHAEGRSAIREIARHILTIEDATDYARQLTFNIGQVHGGTTDNTVPEHCTARIDVRGNKLADLEEAEAFLRGLKSHDPDVTLTLTGQINRPPYAKSPEIAALFEHAKQLAGEVGLVLEDTATGGGSDGSFVANRVPTLDGLGVNGAGAHTLEEYLEVSSLQTRMALMRRLFETLQ
ncbi:MAG: M20 family metallopeptidase [Pseudomonadota bacterium]